MSGNVFGSEVSTIPEEPTLTGRTTLEDLIFEGTLVGLSIERWGAIPRWHGEARTRACTGRGALESLTFLALERRTLMSDGVPSFRNDERPIVILRPVEEHVTGEVESAEAGVRREGLQK